MKKPILTFPCKYNFDDFESQYCMYCSKQVFDFSNLTKEQILEKIESADEIVCGKVNVNNVEFNNTQLVVQNFKRTSISLLALLGFSAMYSSVDAQTSQITDSVSEQKHYEKLKFPLVIHGTVKDKNNKAVESASVFILEDEKVLKSTQTDLIGKFVVIIKEGELPTPFFSFLLTIDETRKFKFDGLPLSGTFYNSDNFIVSFSVTPVSESSLDDTTLYYVNGNFKAHSSSGSVRQKRNRKK